METNSIVILVLWIVMIIYILIYIIDLVSKNTIQKNIYVVLTVIFILTTLANAAYSIYLTITDKPNNKNDIKDKWLVSSIISCIFIIVIILVVSQGKPKLSNKTPLSTNAEVVQ
jgi:cytochrome bd-type quinol oxidase subunit 2